MASLQHYISKLYRYISFDLGNIYTNYYNYLQNFVIYCI